MGGHCIPIDPFYLTWKANKLGAQTKLIDLAGKINSSMPSYVINKIKQTIKKSKKTIRNSSILILGLSYKKNTDDMRESPSLEILDKLIEMGFSVDYFDPYILNLPKTRKNNFTLNSTKLDPVKIQSYDVVLLATDHDDIDYNVVYNNARLIVDTRGKFQSSHK